MYAAFMLQSCNAENIISQKFFKKMMFTAASWPRLVYKTVSNEVKTTMECVAQCQVEGISCNIFFFDPESKTCWLGKIGLNLNLIGVQTLSLGGFADLGKHF
jgi:hypothetical protein